MFLKILNKFILNFFVLRYLYSKKFIWFFKTSKNIHFLLTFQTRSHYKKRHTNNNISAGRTGQLRGRASALRSKCVSARGQGILMNWWDIFCARDNQNAQPQFFDKIHLFFYICKLTDPSHLLELIGSGIYTLPSE